jgi:membrane protein implicated in regulation of membrane protease activity
LLLANTLVNELLPLVLEALFPGGYFSWVASVVLILFLGEIVPQVRLFVCISDIKLTILRQFVQDMDWKLVQRL